jgi:ribosomal protein S24E
MTQALYAHMNNKTIKKIKIKKNFLIKLIQHQKKNVPVKSNATGYMYVGSGYRGVYVFNQINTRWL